jgi:hypothetical protein
MFGAELQLAGRAGRLHEDTRHHVQKPFVEETLMYSAQMMTAAERLNARPLLLRQSRVILNSKHHNR